MGGQVACQQTDIDLGIHRKIYLKKQNSPFRFLRSMDTKAKMQEEILATQRLRLAVKK